MRIANWEDYELLDTSTGERLERWGNVILVRPDPQIIWNTPKNHLLWQKAHAKYKRSNKGGGKWQIIKKLPEFWNIHYKDLSFRLKTMGFKHTGIFPEQATNWDFMIDKIKSSNRQINVLNLFAYTGAATLACASAGAKVCHVDASKGMVLWAKENAKDSSLSDKPIRFIVDDCMKFVQREIKRGNKYDAIIMDPPSYGRGPGGEIWKLEEKLFDFLKLCESVLSKEPLFFILNSYTTGLSPAVMEYLVKSVISSRHKGSVISGEVGLRVTSSGLALPSGSTVIWQS